MNRSFVPPPFLSYSSSPPPPLFTMVQIFYFFVSKMIDTGKTTEKVRTIQQTCAMLMKVQDWIPFEIDFSMNENSRNIVIFFYRASVIKFARKIERIVLIG